MKRPALVAAALVAVVLGVLAVRGCSRDTAPPRAPAAPAPARVPVAPAPPSPPEPASPALAVGPAGAPAPVAAAAPQPWSAVRVAGRISELGPAARFLSDGLSDARLQMEPCFEDEVRRLEAAPPPEIDPNDPPRGSAALMLHVESRGDELVVVDAELDYLGTSTLELVACCRERLAGWRMPAQGIPSGQRWRLKYLLQ